MPTESIRLLYLVTSALSSGFLRGQLAFMRDRGFHVVVGSSPGKEMDDIARDENVEACPLHMAREIAPLQDLVSLWKLVRLMRRFKPHVVVAGTPKAGLLGTIATFLACVPVRIYHLRGLRAEKTRGLKRIILANTERIASGLASRVWCVSPSIRNLMIEQKLAAPNKLTVFQQGSSNGIDTQKFNWNPQIVSDAMVLAQKWNLAPNAPVVLFIGRLVQDKGIVELADAFRLVLQKIPTARLFVVGPEETGDPIPKETLTYLQNHPNIHLTGRDRPAPYLALTDVFVLPTYREGFPNVVLEAAAIGIPTIGTKATGVVDAIVDGETGTLVSIGDAKGLAEAMIDYLSNPNKRRQHGLAGRKRAVRDFQPQDIWQAYYENMTTLLREKGISPPEPIVERERIQVDLDADDQETREWLAVREIVLKGGTMDSACQLFDVEPSAVQDRGECLVFRD